MEVTPWVHHYATQFDGQRMMSWPISLFLTHQSLLILESIATSKSSLLLSFEAQALVRLFLFLFSVDEDVDLLVVETNQPRDRS